jgi:RHS repeat-associated protein
MFPIAVEVSEVEQSLIDQIKTTGKEKNYELIEYLNDINRTYAEILVEQNIHGVTDTTYTYGVTRLSLTRFDESSGYYLYDPKGSVTGVTNEEGQIYQSYRYDSFGEITFGEPQYENEYTYNGESYNPGIESQYLRARYYDVTSAAFLTEDSYLGNITEPLTLNRYNYVLSSPLNYIDPSGHFTTAEGKEAHVFLQKHLQMLYPKEIETEYHVTNHPTNPSKTGEIDVLYKGDTKWEVYEIKPISYQNSSYKKQAIQQRKNYIIALETMREEEIERGHNTIKNVNSLGRTLDAVISSAMFPSIIYPDKVIKYSVDANNPGIVYWRYNKKPNLKSYLAKKEKEANKIEYVRACFEKKSAYEKVKIGINLFRVGYALFESGSEFAVNNISNNLNEMISDIESQTMDNSLFSDVGFDYNDLMDFGVKFQYTENEYSSMDFGRNLFEMAPFYSQFAPYLLP